MSNVRTAVRPRRSAASSEVDSVTATAPRRILDAAEAVFAQQGYHGATIRTITEAAGVPLSLARYHFGSKDELYRMVLARRAEETCVELEKALESSQATALPGGELEAVVSAMVSLSADRLARGDSDWRHYHLLLTQQAQLTDRPDLIDPFRARFASTLHAYRRGLQSALPLADDETIEFALHILQVVVGHALLDWVPMNALSEAQAVPQSASKWDVIRNHVVAHVVGGIRAQLALQLGARAAAAQPAQGPAAATA